VWDDAEWCEALDPEFRAYEGWPISTRAMSAARMGFICDFRSGFAA
jgi:hypothetical protein